MNAFFHIDQARRLDAADPLGPFRREFHVPVWKGEEVIYLTGNSLGLQPVGVSEAIAQELHDWKTLGVEGHFHAKRPWMPYHEFLTDSLARLAGAKGTEVVAMGSLTANLHFAMASFYRPTPERRAILCEAKAFPSDRYALVSQLAFHGYPESDLIEVPGSGADGVPTDEDLIAAIQTHGSRVATMLIGGVNYFTGRVYDMARITAAARAQGIVVGWDLAHAMGNVPLSLHDWDVDFAAWCSYKYLNAGPGGTAGLFVHQRHHHADLPRLAGWWGHNKESRFHMGPGFDPIPSAEGWQVSNAPVLSMAAQRASLDLFDRMDLAQHRAKGLDLRHAWTIEGKKIKSVMDLHTQCKIVLVSHSPKFAGIPNRDIISHSQQQPSVDHIKPTPSSWINKATSRWTNSNSVADANTLAKTFESQ